MTTKHFTNDENYEIIIEEEEEIEEKEIEEKEEVEKDKNDYEDRKSTGIQGYHPSIHTVDSVESKRRRTEIEEKEGFKKKTWSQLLRPASKPVSPSKPPPPDWPTAMRTARDPEAADIDKPVIPLAPLAERMRPQTLADVVGQDHLLGEGTLFRGLVDGSSKGPRAFPSFVLFGPPGSGKTTIARLVAHRPGLRYVQCSAVTSGVPQLREMVAEATRERGLGRATVLFLDEIHRFNKAQQDYLLPHMESGLLSLVGATTENPSFELNKALLSRCRVFTTQKLEAESIARVLRRALRDPEHGLKADGLVTADPFLDDAAIEYLAAMADGDLRIALNALEMCFYSLVKTTDPVNGSGTLTVEDVKKMLQRTHVAHDKNGEEHYNLISALHKSVRGGDADAALYWLGRMLQAGDDPLYVARRMVRMASEDIGLADPQALSLAVAAFQAAHALGMPECDVVLAQCAVYLARAKKNVDVYNALAEVKRRIAEEPNDPVPMHIRNAPTPLMQQLGYSVGYVYNPSVGYRTGAELGISYLPDRLAGVSFLKKQADDIKDEQN